MQFWLQKFRVALRGIGLNLKEEASCQVHAAATIGVMAVAAWLRVTTLEAALLTLCITGVLTAELLNSGIERLARAMHRDADPHLRDALDLAAGGVLMMAVGASIVGGLVLGSRAWAAFLPGAG